MVLKVKMTAMTLELVQGFMLMQQRRSGRQITECFPMSQKRFGKYLSVQAYSLAPQTQNSTSAYMVYGTACALLGKVHLI